MKKRLNQHHSVSVDYSRHASHWASKVAVSGLKFVISFQHLFKYIFLYSLNKDVDCYRPHCCIVVSGVRGLVSG
jgi:hypothetical protein